MSPWKIKEDIDIAMLGADRNGFRLGSHFQYGERICLFTKGDNEHGFANDIVLQTFDTWTDVTVFFAGWNKAQLVKAVTKARKKK